MRLVIRNRLGTTAGGLRRYNGSGMFSSIGRKLFSSGLKTVINAATKANLPQKLADVVVNGAQSAGERLGKVAGEKVGKFAGKKLEKVGKTKLGAVVQRGIKRKLGEYQNRQQEVVVKQPKVDINHLIDGSGIVFD